MAVIEILCGKVASGKSTFARRHAKEIDGVHLSVDEVMLKVYEGKVPCEDHAHKVALVKDSLYTIAKRILDAGSSVILDFGFWTAQERQEVIETFDGYDLILRYFKIEETLQLARLHKRNALSDPNEYKMDEATCLDLNSRFEEPTEMDRICYEIQI